MERVINMTMFLGRDPSASNPPWKEWQIQAFAVMELRRAGYLVHGDQNGAAKSRSAAGLAQATGMLKGWPDLCVLVPGCPLFVELKTGAGRLSKDQQAVHSHMAEMGYPVTVIHADSPADALAAILKIIRKK